MNTDKQIKPATPLPWQPVIVTEIIERYHVVLRSANGKESFEVMVLAPTIEDAEEHAQAQYPTMHVSDSWGAY